MDEKIKLLVDSLGDIRVKQGEKLLYHTYNKIAGSAKAFYIATSQRELVEILEIASQLKIPFLVIGSGTKVIIAESEFKGVVIKNRSGVIKIGGIKGKVGRGGLGIEEALVEVDSGVTLGKLDEYLTEQGLQSLSSINPKMSTLGGALFIDPHLKNITQGVKIWNDGEIFDIEIIDLKSPKQIILSVVLKVKSKEI